MMKCPYCNKSNFIPEVAFLNEESYGNSFHTIACVHCKKIVDVTLSRTVRVTDASKSTQKHSEYAQ